MKSYHDMLNHVLTNGVRTANRTGVDTLDTFGYAWSHDLREGFPILTTKKLHWKSIVYELLWFLRGEDNINFLKDNGVTIWDEWAKEDGSIGPVYGVQWRKWAAHEFRGNNETIPDKATWIPSKNGRNVFYQIDQLAQAIDTIKNNPTSRRIVVSAWNPADLSKMGLPPCHMIYQFSVSGEYLDLLMMQRSADLFLGVPFNMASYALLLSMVSHVTGKTPRKLMITTGSLHLYVNHLDQARLQLTREPKPLPKLFLSPGIENIDDFQYGDCVLIDYEAYPNISAAIAA